MYRGIKLKVIKNYSYKLKRFKIIETKNFVKKSHLYFAMTICIIKYLFYKILSFLQPSLLHIITICIELTVRKTSMKKYTD